MLTFHRGPICASDIVTKVGKSRCGKLIFYHHNIIFICQCHRYHHPHYYCQYMARPPKGGKENKRQLCTGKTVHWQLCTVSVNCAKLCRTVHCAELCTVSLHCACKLCRTVQNCALPELGVKTYTDSLSADTDIFQIRSSSVS